MTEFEKRANRVRDQLDTEQGEFVFVHVVNEQIKSIGCGNPRMLIDALRAVADDIEAGASRPA